MDFRAQWAKDVGQTVAEAVAKCSRPVMEPKYDGWRCILVRDADGVHIWNPSRNSDPGKNYDGQLPELEADAMKLPVGTILDGELVALSYEVDEDRWVNDFFRIHTVMRSKSTTAQQRSGIRFVVFDIVQAVGDPDRIIATKPLSERRDYIEALLRMSETTLIDLTLQVPATQENWDALVAQGFEGTVVKDADKPYGFGKRGHGWFKVKNTRTIDCVVIEVVQDGKGRNEGLAGRMIVGQYVEVEPCDALRNPTGEKIPVLTKVCVVNCLNDKQRKQATDNPEQFVGQVIEVKIYGWDTEGPRHPTPLRFREDKLPHECVWSRV